MIIAISILLVILTLLAVLLFSDFLVILSVSDKALTVKIRVLHITIRIPFGEKQEKKPKKENTPEKEETEDSIMKKFLEMRNTFARIREALEKTLGYLAQKIKVQEAGVIGKFGLGNAALTGMSYGAVEAFSGVVTGLLQHFLKFEKPPYRNVQMDYDHFVFQLNFAMILKTKPIYLLKAGLIFLKSWKQ